MAEADFDVFCPDISETSNEDINREMQRRIANGSWFDVEEHKTHPWTRVGMASDIRTAFYARDATRLEMILAALEEREE